jgi:hypothetical protein
LELQPNFVPGDITVRAADAAYTANGPTTSETNPDPAIVLGHELIHASHIVAGTASFDRTATHDFVIRSGSTYESYQESNPRHFPREEFRTVGFYPYAQRREVTENRLRRELNRPLRVAYYQPRNWVCTSCGP